MTIIIILILNEVCVGRNCKNKNYWYDLKETYFDHNNFDYST